MPELPDIEAYIFALKERIMAQPIEQIRLASPFLLRTVSPPLERVEGHVVTDLRRIGKRIAIGVEGDLWLVLHLMIAGVSTGEQRERSLAAVRILPRSTSPTDRSYSPRLAQRGVRHCMCLPGKRHCD